MGRSVDFNTSGLIGAEQRWLVDGWHARLGLDPDPRDFLPGFPPINDLARTFRAPHRLLMDSFD